MPRLKVQEKVVKRLFALSGNQCAFTGCTSQLVNDEAVLGEICHIEAAEFGGQRYNEHSNDDDRRDFKNLILLCRDHHVITNNVNTYPVKVMVEMKAAHERKFLHAPYYASDNVVQKAIDNISIQHNSNFGNQIISTGGNPSINNNTINNIYESAKQTASSTSFKLLDTAFWNQIKESGISSEKFLLNLHSEEKTICSAIVNNLVCSIDYYFVNEEDKINNIEWEVQNALSFGENKLISINSASGAGKTTLLYYLAYLLHKSCAVIKINRVVKAPLDYVAEYGVILLDEIQDHIQYLTEYNEFFKAAFPRGFVFFIAEQPPIWDRFVSDNRSFLRGFNDPSKIDIRPQGATLIELYENISKVVAAKNPEMVSALMAMRREFVTLRDSDSRTIADRMIDLYSDIKTSNNGLGRYLKPDWVTVADLGDNSLINLYALTAYTNYYLRDFDIKLLEGGDQFTSAISSISGANDGNYPLQLLDGETKIRLRHYRIAKWFFLENPGKRVIAEMFFRKIFNEDRYTPEKVSLLRYFYRRNKDNLFKILGWGDQTYHDKLMDYYYFSRRDDVNKEGRKSYYEALKVLFKNKREEYDLKMSEKITSLNVEDKEWFYAADIVNHIGSGDFSAAIKRIEECRNEVWFDATIRAHEENAYYKQAKLSLNISDRLPEDVFDRYPLNTILRLAKELMKSENRPMRLDAVDLFAHYYKNSESQGSNIEKENDRTFHLYCRMLINEKRYNQVIEEITDVNFEGSPLLTAFLGFAILNHWNPEKFREYGTPKDLIYKSFCDNPTNGSTLLFLNILLNKNRVTFSKEELLNLQEKLESLQITRPHPLLFKSLSDISKKLNDFTRAVEILRTALLSYPEKEFIRVQLGTVLVAMYQDSADESLKTEVEKVISSCTDRQNGYFKILMINYYHSLTEDIAANNKLASALAEELLSFKEFNRIGGYMLVKSAYNLKKHQECIDLILKHFFDRHYYADYEVNNWFYFCLLNISKVGDEGFKSNYIKYRFYIEELMSDPGFETNDYFKYICHTIYREYEVSGTTKIFVSIEAAIKKDGAASLNVNLLIRILEFLFATRHYNSLHNLVNIIRRANLGNEITPAIMFHYRACGLICNNRFFITGPFWQDGADNFVIFPKKIAPGELSKLIDTYLDVFAFLGRWRRRIVFCFCLLRDYGRNPKIRGKITKMIATDMRLLYRSPLIQDRKINEKGFIFRFSEQTFQIKSENKVYGLISKDISFPIKKGQQSKNWSYFSVTESQRATFIEPGFVIDGFHDSEVQRLKTGQVKLKLPQGILFQIWLYNENIHKIYLKN